MPKKSNVCETPECDEPVVAAGLCSNCYGWAHYHKNKSVAENQAYKKRMRRAANRIERHMQDRKVTKSTGRTRYTERGAYVN